jgi:hypothetical protein
VARKKEERGSKFVVDLGTFRLPAVVEEQVESEIRAVVLRAMADPTITTAREVDKSLFDRYPWRTRGLWIDPNNPEKGTWEETVQF